MQDLMAKRSWVYWQYELRDGKTTKVLKNPYTGTNARTDDPETWGWYGDCGGKGDGRGIVLPIGYAGVDIDAHDVDKNPLQDEVMELFAGTYAEKSPSGKGIHILFMVDMNKLPLNDKGKVDPIKFYQKNPHNDLECYVGGCTNRYLTYTGNQVSDEGYIAEMTDQFLYFINKYMRKKGYDVNENMLDDIRKSNQGAKFTALYDYGDTSAYNGDDSSADLALCNILAYWIGDDEAAINEAFTSSKLYREKWERADYSHATIQKAIDLCGGTFKKYRGRPRNPNAASNMPYLTVELLEDELEARGTTLRFNEITQSIEVIGSGLNQQHVLNDLPTKLFSELQDRYRNVNETRLMGYIYLIAHQNAYNPVLDLLNSQEWDGKHRFSQVYSALGIENDEFSQTLVYKWFWQGITLLHNTYEHSVQPDGVLTLAGPQGCGKTTFFRKVAIDESFFKDGQSITSRDKDNERRAITTWISELGELDCTFKTGAAYLKKFITRANDRYRLQYARTDEDVPRRTNLGATVNGTEFLIDQTGNRRYWVIEVEDIDRDALDAIEWAQVWLEVWHDGYDKDPNGFRLDRDELLQLEQRNHGYEKPMKGEELIQGILENGREWDFITVGEFMECHNLMGRLTDTEVGAVLNKLGYPKKSVRGYDGKVRKMRELPRR